MFEALIVKECVDLHHLSTGQETLRQMSIACRPFRKRDHTRLTVPMFPIQYKYSLVALDRKLEHSITNWPK